MMPRARLTASLAASLATLSFILAPLAAPMAMARPPEHYAQTLRGLLDKEAIREQLVLYGLLIDGDGIARDSRKWADQLWTADAVFQVYDAQGRSLFAGPKGLVGRETVYGAFGQPLPFQPSYGVRHVFSSPHFEELTPTSATTRTIGFVIRGAKAESSDTAVMQSPVSSYIFHDTWRKEADGIWRKAVTTVYCSTACARSPLSK